MLKDHYVNAAIFKIVTIPRMAKTVAAKPVETRIVKIIDASYRKLDFGADIFRFQEFMDTSKATFAA